LRAIDESRLRRLMKVWRQAFGVQRAPTTLNAQPVRMTDDDANDE